VPDGHSRSGFFIHDAIAAGSLSISEPCADAGWNPPPERVPSPPAPDAGTADRLDEYAENPNRADLGALRIG